MGEDCLTCRVQVVKKDVEDDACLTDRKSESSE